MIDPRGSGRRRPGRADGPRAVRGRDGAPCYQGSRSPAARFLSTVSPWGAFGDVAMGGGDRWLRTMAGAAPAGPSPIGPDRTGGRAGPRPGSTGRPPPSGKTGPGHERSLGRGFPGYASPDEGLREAPGPARGRSIAVAGRTARAGPGIGRFRVAHSFVPSCPDRAAAPHRTAPPLVPRAQSERRI